MGEQFLSRDGKRCAVLFSGGKDSCLALHLARQEGYDIKFLLTVLPDSKDALLFHTPDLKLLKKQVELFGIKLVVEKAKFGEKNELSSLDKLLKKVKGKVDVIVLGGIASSYQTKRFKKEIENKKMKVYAPLWNFSSDKLWEEIFKEKMEIILTKIACEGLDKKWLGRIIDKKKFSELKKLNERYKFDLTGEGGDFETAVLFSPEFKKHIKIRFNIKSEGKYRHFLIVK